MWGSVMSILFTRDIALHLTGEKIPGSAKTSVEVQGEEPGQGSGLHG